MHVPKLFFILILAGSLVGCTVTGNNGGTNVSDASTAPGPMTIDWKPQNDAPVENDSPVIKELERILNVKFNFIYMNRNKETELLNVRIASGAIPDVMVLHEDQYRSYIRQGTLLEIQEAFLKERAPAMYGLVVKNAGEATWNFAKENGKLYGIPILDPYGEYPFIPIWRDDWLRNVGIGKIPETLEEAETAFYKFARENPDKNEEKDTYALSDTGMGPIFGAFGGIPYFSAGGGNVFTWTVRDGKAVATAVLPEMKEALLLLNKWYKAGLIDPEFINGESKGRYWGSSVTFWNGKIGFSCPGQFYHINPPLNDRDAGSNNYLNFKKVLGEYVSYVPGKPIKGPGGKSGTECWGVVSGYYLVLGKNVSKTQGKLEKIIEIAEKLVSDFEVNKLAVFGIEGVTYEIVDGNYTLIGDASTIEGMAGLGIAAEGIGQIAANNIEFYRNTRKSYFEYGDKLDGLSTGYTNSIRYDLPSNGQYRDTINRMIRESYALFISGEKSPDDFDRFVQELNEAGLSQLTKEANEWYQKHQGQS